jgi:aconitate hydratase
VTIDLSSLEPQVVGPHSPDRLHDLSALGETARRENFPLELSSCLIGSCTNSSYEDLGRAAKILEEAFEKGLKLKTRFFISPGSNRVYDTIKRDGILAVFEKAGAVVLANACGPCIGQWQRDDSRKGDVNSIITSFNRNFRARNDANPETLSFIASPETVTVLALAGTLDFSPTRDSLTTDSGEKVTLKAPEADELPARPFAPDPKGFVPPVAEGASLEVKVSSESKRLQLLTPFAPWDGRDFENLPLLLKAKGKCTTDHISAAGPWLRFRGHLDNISDNMFLGALNAFTGENGSGKNQLTGDVQKFPEVARHYKKENLGWVVVGDDNNGEGSRREHAAM